MVEYNFRVVSIELETNAGRQDKIIFVLWWRQWTSELRSWGTSPERGRDFPTNEEVVTTSKYPNNFVQEETRRVVVVNKEMMISAKNFAEKSRRVEFLRTHLYTEYFVKSSKKRHLFPIVSHL